MKPPHGNRPPGGGNRPPGGGGGPRPHGPRPQGPRPHHQGGGGPPRDDRGPRPQGSGFGPPRHERDRDRQQHPHPHGGHHQHQRPRHEGPRHAPEAPRGAVWLYGSHAVAAALANPHRRLRRLVVTEEAEAELTTRLPPPWPLAPERADRGRLDYLLGRDIAHQGIALLSDPLATPSLQQALERPGPLVVLDQVTDPRNVGAILRSAAAFGAAAVITQDRNAPEETGSLAKAASGALETVPLLRAVNIARTLIALKAASIWCVGLDRGGSLLSGAALAGRRVALVLGAEGTGLRRLTRETCDEIASLPMPGLAGNKLLDSLNVSAAAAIGLYELTRPSMGGPS